MPRKLKAPKPLPQFEPGDYVMFRNAWSMIYQVQEITEAGPAEKQLADPSRYSYLHGAGPLPDNEKLIVLNQAFYCFRPYTSGFSYKYRLSTAHNLHKVQVPILQKYWDRVEKKLKVVQAETKLLEDFEVAMRSNQLKVTVTDLEIDEEVEK